MYSSDDDISPSSTTTALHHGGAATPISAIHGDIIQSHILNRLDGPTLSSTSCASSQMLALCSDDHLWRDICNATWPSTTDSEVASAISAFPSGHRSFYSDAFPSIKPNTPVAFKQTNSTKTALEDTITTCEQLISAVDIFYDDELVYSKVLVTKTTSSWFLSTPFRLDLLTEKETVRICIPMKIDDNDDSSGSSTDHHHHQENNIINANGHRLRISWILIDPTRRRAINVASREALEARRHWLTSDVQFRYATVVMAGSGEQPVQCAVLFTCGDAHVREVSLQVEDMEGKVLPGRDSLVILRRAMEGQRCKCDQRLEKDMYETFLKMRLRFREMRQRRERCLDTACVVTGVLLFIAILVRLIWS